MRRLSTMSRFEDQKEEEVISNCEQCTAELYSGQEVYEFEGYHFEEKSCVLDYLLDEKIIKRINLRKEDCM